MTLGNLSAIAIYLSQLSGVQGSLAQFLQERSLGVISWERLELILAAEPVLADDSQAKEASFFKGQIEFKDVSFFYKQEKQLFNKLSFSIPGGSRIALAGPSGCGKTTILNLTLRLYKPTAGNILIDGHNVNTIKAKSLYGQVGVVLQEPYLWNDTIENNIGYGSQLASFQEITEAARLACIDDFIIGLPLGYRSVIGENACRISEGQKQRLAIARALIKKPRIIILDEALSCVDARIKEEIIDNITSVFNESTIIVISHRLSTIKKMDSVYFLSRNNNVDIGGHEDLLRNNAQYQNYLAHQLSAEALPVSKLCQAPER